MALNACSINGFTLHSRRCADKFARLIPLLRPTPPDGDGGAAGVGVGGVQRRETFKYNRPFEIEDQPKYTFEQPIVTVEVQILGFSGVDTQDVTAAQVDFVSVSELTVQGLDVDDTLLAVNITDLRIE